MPFKGKNRKAMWHSIARGEWDRKPVHDADLKELLEGLLHRNPSERLDTEGVKKSKWMAAL